MTNQLDLQKVNGYEVRGTSDERGTSHRVGLYKHHARAVEGAKGKGFWCDGEVRDITLYTDGIILYEVKEVGQFTDEKEDFAALMKEQIKSKLTLDEAIFLNL